MWHRGIIAEVIAELEPDRFANTALNQMVARLRAGDVRALARAISVVEGGLPGATELLAACRASSEYSLRIGVTGPPGAGKSTLVDQMARRLRQEGKTVAVLAVDPTSPYTGGALLGDRIRMQDLAGDEGVYVRSVASRGATGGITRTAGDVCAVMEAAGRQVVVIETVGVGQDEVEIVGAAHTIVVLSPPGLGDDIQAIKAGILEIADIHVVSKADKPEAGAAVAALRGMLSLGASRPNSKWACPVLAVSSISGEHLEKLKFTIGQHWTHLHDSGEFAERQRYNSRTRIFNTARHSFQQQFEEHADVLEAQLQAVIKREADPRFAAQVLLGWKRG